MNNQWSDEDIGKMKQEYLSGKREMACPSQDCSGLVKISKLEGEDYVNKKFVKTHFFIDYECDSCERKHTGHYRKSGMV